MERKNITVKLPGRLFNDKQKSLSERRESAENSPI